MNFEQILGKFYQGVNWNAYLYAIYKVTSTIVTLFLFKHLKTQHFAAWANIYSIIYLTLLLADFGFRKSLPRYCPEFARNTSAIKRFIRGIILFETIVLACFMPIIIGASYKLTGIFDISDIYIFYAIPAIFAIEGIVSIVRLIYHSHFWQKSFNLIYSAAITTEAAINMLLIFTITKSKLLLKAILLTKLAAGVVILGVSLVMLKLFYKGGGETKTEEIDYDDTMKGFKKHSAMMWGNTTLRSLSERNFLVPLLTVIAGAESASIFKIANDGALLFQRIVLKAIGTTDTSLLAHVDALQVNMLNEDTLPEKKKLTSVAFEKLSTKIATLCFPLLGVFILIVGMVSNQIRNSWGFQFFCIITISYLLESMLLPFERLLEVKKHYGYLGLAYGVYALLILFLILLLSMSWIGLALFIVFLCSVRLVSLLVMSWVGKRLFNVSMPFHTYRSIGMKTLVLTSVIYVLFLQIPFLNTGFYSFMRVVMKIP